MDGLVLQGCMLGDGHRVKSNDSTALSCQIKVPVAQTA